MTKRSKIVSRKDNVIKGGFALSNQPIAYQISIVMRNMYNTYGHETVQHVLKDLFNYEKVNQKKRKAS